MDVFWNASSDTKHRRLVNEAWAAWQLQVLAKIVDSTLNEQKIVRNSALDESGTIAKLRRSDSCGTLQTYWSQSCQWSHFFNLIDPAFYWRDHS